MVDALKIAAKVAIIAAVTGIIIALFTGAIFPAVNLTPIRNAVGFGRAMYEYYCGGAGISILINLGMWLLVMRYIGVPTVKLGFIAFKWIMAVNK